MDYSETRAGTMWVRTHMIAGHLSCHPVQIAIDKPAFFPKILYTARARIESAAQALQTHRTTMRENRAGSFVALAFGFILVKSVHTAELTTNTAQGSVRNGSCTLAGIAIVKSIDLIRKTNAREGRLRAALPQVQPPFAAPKTTMAAAANCDCVGRTSRRKTSRDDGQGARIASGQRKDFRHC